MAIDRFGGPEELALHDVPLPTPGPGEVLVQVAYAGTNPVDYKMRDGSSRWVQSFTADDFPFVPGREFSGIVVAVGDGADLALGQRVLGVSPTGSYATHVAVSGESVAPLADDVDLAQAGGLGITGLTALQAVRDLGRVHAGDTVLIHGGGGGVGQIATQLAVATGADVWVTASGRHRENIERWGAHHVDYTTTDFTTVVPTPSVVIDGVYFDTYERSLALLSAGDRLVVLPSLADLAPAKAKGLNVAIPHVQPSRAQLSLLADMLRDGRLDIVISQILPLADAPQAHRILEGGHAQGKILLEVEGA